MILCTCAECGEAQALGMESRDIRNRQITASSFYAGNRGEFQAWKGRLNNNHYWATASSSPRDPWIQVDLLRSTVVTGIITQGGTRDRYQEWVTDLNIQYGHSVDLLMYILGNAQPKVSTFICF